MKNKIFFIVLFSLVLSCTSKDKDEANNTTTQNVTPPTKTNDTGNIAPAPPVLASPIWKIEPSDDGLYYETTKADEVDTTLVLTPELIANTLNSKWPNIQLVFVKQNKDTVFVSIPNSEYLTQRMGSSGSETYLVNAIYNFTEIKGVKYLNLDFAEGDHLMPGTFSREGFKVKAKK